MLKSIIVWFWGLFPVSDVPEYVERYRFPPQWYCQHMMCVNREHHYWLQEVYAWDHIHREEIGEWIRENNRVFEIWNRLDWVWREEHSHWSGWNNLERLRFLMGREAYNRGEMPPAVPTWMFREVK